MKRSWLSSILCAALSVVLSCSGSHNIAGGTDRLLLSADPPQIGAGGTSALTVSGTDENGVPLPDGTTITFSVDKAGRVSPASIQLQNGSASTTYFATLTPGDMTITAMSGSVQAQVTVTVADTIQQKVFVSAVPNTFPSGGGTAVISAAVTDNSGKPLENVNVQFSTTAGTLQSGGDILETNANGIVTDILNTSESATVTASTGDGFSGQVSILVGVGQVVCHMTANKSQVKVGETVLFFDTTDIAGNQITSFHWDFDDGVTSNGQNVQHAYTSAGTFNVVHSVTDSQSNTLFCDPFPIQVSQ